jgi:hypothetical protein
MAADIFLLSKFARAGAGTTPDQLPSLGDEGDLSLVGAQD